MRPDVAADTARRNRARPAGDHRHAETALVQIPFDAAQSARALEEHRIATALLMGSVVADEHDEGAGVEVLLRTRSASRPMSRSIRVIIAANAAFGVG